MHVDEARGTDELTGKGPGNWAGQGQERNRQWAFQGKGPGPWGNYAWTQEETPGHTGYPFGGIQQTTDDWGGKQEGGIAAMTKGKGKGTRTFLGKCSTCGIIGHKAANCPQRGQDLKGSATIVI